LIETSAITRHFSEIIELKFGKKAVDATLIAEQFPYIGWFPYDFCDSYDG